MCLLSLDQNLNPKIQVLEINMSARRFARITRSILRMKKDFWVVLDLYFHSHGLQLDIALYILESCQLAFRPFSQARYPTIF